jgi:hypothetical protein
MCVTLPFKTIGCALLLLSIPSPPALAQQLPDSASFHQSTALLRQYVRDRLSPDSRLYNGYEYIRNGTPARGFPFFDSDGLQNAQLTYDGILYRDMPLEYDLVLDEVVIHDYTGKILIGLISEKIDHFSIGSHEFRYFPADQANPASGPPSQGFYEVLLSSDAITLLARREKKLVLPSNREDPARYDQQNFYFLHKDGRFYSVDGRIALLEAMKDRKDALKKYIRENKLHFKKQLETALIRTTAYYMQLSH